MRISAFQRSKQDILVSLSAQINTRAKQDTVVRVPLSSIGTQSNCIGRKNIENEIPECSLVQS